MPYWQPNTTVYILDGILASEVQSSDHESCDPKRQRNCPYNQKLEVAMENRVEGGIRWGLIRAALIFRAKELPVNKKVSAETKIL